MCTGRVAMRSAIPSPPLAGPLTALALSVTLAACAGGDDRAQASQGMARSPQNVLADRVSRWTSAMETLHVPGMVVSVVGPEGPLMVEELGRRKLGEDLPVTSDTRFYIASATKPFVSLATALLAHRDSIQLNRPVRTYLPRFELADYTESITITVRDLLAHRRGLQDYAITFGEAFSGQMNEDRFYRLLREVEAVGELDYQNLHYTILGRVIEAVSGLTWKEFLEREVLRPAGMDRTTSRAAPLRDDPDAATPYEYVDGDFRAVRLKTNRTMHAAGGMVSTAEDLARWVRLHLNGGRLDGEAIFPPDVIREMQEPQIYEEDPSPIVPEHRRIGWGLAWDVREDRGARLFYHGGRYEGWSAHVSFMPEIETGLVVLANTGDAGLLLAQAVMADVYDRVRGLEPRDVITRVASMFEAVAGQQAEDAAGARGERSPGAGPSLPLDRYVGTYVNEDWGTLEVWAEGGEERNHEEDEGGDGGDVELKARIGDLPLPLIWVGADSLVADEDHRGRFEIRDGRVRAISLSALAADGLVRFERR